MKVEPCMLELLNPHNDLVAGRVRRWCWVTFSAGCLTYLDNSGSWGYCACSRFGWGIFYISLLSIISFLPPSL